MRGRKGGINQDICYFSSFCTVLCYVLCCGSLCMSESLSLLIREIHMAGTAYYGGSLAKYNNNKSPESSSKIVNLI
jgi:hypothetical protein